jgi:phosphate-selective porin
MIRILKTILASIMLVLATSAAQAAPVTYILETPGVV